MLGQIRVASLVFLCIQSPQAFGADTERGSSITFERPGLASQKVNEILASLRPPTSLTNLGKGSDLLLEFSDVAAVGTVRVKMVSTIPRTEGMWLLTLSSRPEGGSALLGSIALGPSAMPEATFMLNLARSQELLLVVRAAGKYYAVQREIKIGHTSPAQSRP